MTFITFRVMLCLDQEQLLNVETVLIIGSSSIGAPTVKIIKLMPCCLIVKSEVVTGAAMDLLVCRAEEQ